MIISKEEAKEKMANPQIRDFVYLDSDRLISLSSQIFEGFVDAVVSHDGHEESESEAQQGPIASGRRLENLLISRKGRSEARTLADHAFSLLEDHLFNNGLLSDGIDGNTSFVRVKGKAIIQDIPSIVYLMKNFNNFGKQFAITQAVDLQTGDLKIELPQTSNRNARAKNALVGKSSRTYEAIARKMGLQMDQDAMEAMAGILEFGHPDGLDIIIPIDDRIVSAPLNRMHLRQDLSIMLRKFGRRTEREFTMVGRVSRRGDDVASLSGFKGDSMKAALLGIQNSLVEIDDAMNNRLNDEVVVDPIAVYVI